MFCCIRVTCFQTTNGNLKELFPVGAQQVVPLVTRLGDERLLVQRDKMSVIINADGEPTSREPINWSDIPVAMGVYLTLYSTRF